MANGEFNIICKSKGSTETSRSSSSWQIHAELISGQCITLGLVNYRRKDEAEVLRRSTAGEVARRGSESKGYEPMNANERRAGGGRFIGEHLHKAVASSHCEPAGAGGLTAYC